MDDRRERARGRHLADGALDGEQPAELAGVGVREGGVAREGAFARAAAIEHVAELAAAGEAEVDRGADPLGGQRQAVPGGVAGEEHAVLDGGAKAVGDPVPLEALRRDAEVAGEPDSRLLDVVGGPEGPHADAELVAGGEAPAVTGADVAGVDPQLHVAALAVGMDLEAAREGRVRGLDGGRGGEHAAPAERVHDQRGAELAAVGQHRLAVAAGDGRRLELEFAVVGAVPHQRAQLAVVERREGPGQAPAGAAVGGVDDELIEALAVGFVEAEGRQPDRRYRAGRGLALADLVAVYDQHARSGAGEFARQREPREARATDEHVAIALQAGALGPPLRRSHRHMAGNDTAALRFAGCKR